MNSIAIVDDNEAWSFTLGFFLQQHGFQVSSFSNPETPTTIRLKLISHLG
jgi:FixJ family two-component response regulator